MINVHARSALLLLAQPVADVQVKNPRKRRLTSLQTRLIASHALVLLLAMALVLVISAAYLRRIELGAEQQRLAQVAVPLTAEINLLVLSDAATNERTLSRIAELDAQAATMKIRILVLEADGVVRYDSAAKDDLTGRPLPALIDPVGTLIKRANKRDGVQTKVVAGVVDGVSKPNATVLLAAGQTGVPKAKRALLIVSPNRRFPLLALYLPRLLLVTALSLAVGAIASFFLSRRIAEPVVQLTRAADAMAEGELEQVVPGAGPDEIGRLVTSFNLMSHRVASLSRSQRDLLANVAHELRTPLTSVQGYARALRDEVIVDPLERERALATIGRESERMAALIGQLLDLARLESGQSRLVMGQVEASGLVNGVVEQFQPAAVEKGIDLSAQAPLDVLITGDEHRLVQIFSNLVGNAIRHTPPGGSVSLVVETAGDAHLSSGSPVRIRVQDNGEGMSPERVALLFGRFSRGEAAGGGDQTGFGLGLAIVKELVELHRGAIVVQSQPGEGSVFIVDLPAASLR